MTIEKGQPWGEPGTLPADGVLASNDAEARAAVTDARRARRDVPVIGLLGGDLARTCGATGSVERLRGPDAQRLPVDLGEVLVDGALHFFVAHLVVRRRAWRGRSVVVMNAQHIGSWNVAPRSHPNDGRMTMLDADPPLGEMLKIRSRLPTGTHLPHPAISVRSVSGVQFDAEPGTSVWLDGERLGPAAALSVRVVPDALTVVV